MGDGASRNPAPNSVEQSFLVASVHWNAAPNHGTAIADAMEALIAVGLPFCTTPTLETYTSQREFNDASWRVAKRNLAAGRLRWLMFGDPSAGTFQVTWQGKAGLPVASLSVVWPTVRRAEPLYARWYFDAEGLDYAQREMVAAITDIFAMRGACYGLITLCDYDRGLYDWPDGLTRYETIEALVPSLGFPEAMVQPERVTDWVRGVFWGNWLGPGQLARLSGKDRVLADAPCFLSRDLGPGGVYLQATESVWALQPGDLAPLEEFLRPALPTRELLGYPPIRRLTPEEIAANSQIPDPPMLPRRRVPRYSPSFPVERARARGGNVFFALHVEPEPTQELVNAVAELLQPWWEEGAQGAFGGEAPFHYLSDVELDEGAITWFVDWGDASQGGYYDLLRRLDEFAHERGVTVTKLTVQP